MAKVKHTTVIYATENEYLELSSACDAWMRFVRRLNSDDKRIRKLAKAVERLDNELMEMGIE